MSLSSGCRRTVLERSEELKGSRTRVRAEGTGLTTPAMNTDDMASFVAPDQVVRSALVVDAIPVVAVNEVRSFATVFFEEARSLSPEVLWDAQERGAAS